MLATVFCMVHIVKYLHASHYIDSLNSSRNEVLFIDFIIILSRYFLFFINVLTFIEFANYCVVMCTMHEYRNKDHDNDYDGLDRSRTLCIVHRVVAAYPGVTTAMPPPPPPPLVPGRVRRNRCRHRGLFTFSDMIN